MIRRFRLEQKSHYERLVIAQRLSDMLEKFLDGRRAPLAISAEQGDIEEWDDVVIHHPPSTFEHLQVKRQNGPSSTTDPDKAKQLANAAKGKAAAENSVIDKAFGSLAKHASLGTFDATPDRQFQLALPGGDLEIKDGLKVSHLDELLMLCRQEGIDPAELANRKDGPTQRTYLWLTTWCGFIDWTQIRDTLRRVTIVYLGNETTSQQRAIESL